MAIELTRFGIEMADFLIPEESLSFYRQRNHFFKQKRR